MNIQRFLCLLRMDYILLYMIPPHHNFHQKQVRHFVFLPHQGNILELIKHHLQTMMYHCILRYIILQDYHQKPVPRFVFLLLLNHILQLLKLHLRSMMYHCILRYIIHKDYHHQKQVRHFVFQHQLNQVFQ